jgi:UMF1 family MFS transporter
VPGGPHTDTKHAGRRSVTSAWVVYDLANTIFALGVIGLYFPEWMTERNIADSWLAVVEAIAGVVVIFAAPWAGARSDRTGRRMPTLIVTTLVAVAATATLTLEPLTFTFIALGVALVAVNIGSVTYDALLPTVSTPATQGRISGIGVGVGYLGSFIGLGLGILSLDVLGWSRGATFRLLALAFLLFSIPAFVLIREPAGPSPRSGPPLRSVLSGLLQSWRKARLHPNVFRFLVARFLYTDAINTLIGGFLTIFAIEELGLDRAGSRNLLAIAIATAIVGGIAGGFAVEHLGPRRVLRAVLIVWMVAIGSGVTAALTANTAIAWLIGALGGLALGGTWASDRVVMSRISPPEHLGEFYGLYATVGRFATVLGPLVWAIVVDVAGWGRTVALGSLGLFIAAGWLMLARVDDSPFTPIVVPERPA